MLVRSFSSMDSELSSPNPLMVSKAFDETPRLHSQRIQSSIFKNLDKVHKSSSEHFYRPYVTCCAVQPAHSSSLWRRANSDEQITPHWQGEKMWTSLLQCRELSHVTDPVQQTGAWKVGLTMSGKWSFLFPITFGDSWAHVPTEKDELKCSNLLQKDFLCLQMHRISQQMTSKKDKYRGTTSTTG